NGEIYRIVRESEYIDKSIALSYYKPFMERYRDRLAGSAPNIKSYSYESLAITLMGVNHVAGIVGPLLGIIDSKTLMESMA
ncbi:MAG: hypothetical protein ABWW69_02185, partial [Pyrodictiaceae archaeon]